MYDSTVLCYILCMYMCANILYRGMMDENNEQFVAYFIPTQETVKKRQRDIQEGVSYQEAEEYVHVI